MQKVALLTDYETQSRYFAKQDITVWHQCAKYGQATTVYNRWSDIRPLISLSHWFIVSLAMRFTRRSLLPLGVLAGSVLSQETVVGLTRDTAPPGQPFNFDVNTGANLQAATSNQPATSVEFTTQGGSPYTHPYDYQRIGDDGEPVEKFNTMASY